MENALLAIGTLVAYVLVGTGVTTIYYKRMYLPGPGSFFHNKNSLEDAVVIGACWPITVPIGLLLGLVELMKLVAKRIVERH